MLKAIALIVIMSNGHEYAVDSFDSVTACHEVAVSDQALDLIEQIGLNIDDVNLIKCEPLYLD